MDFSKKFRKSKIPVHRPPKIHRWKIIATLFVGLGIGIASGMQIESCRNEDQVEDFRKELTDCLTKKNTTREDCFRITEEIN